MEKFQRLVGKAAPLLLDNIDTDQIIPGGGIFANGAIGRDECGRSLFADWRYLPDGTDNPAFVLNDPHWRDATILLAGHNFGCGSSREWATTALRGYGLRVIVAAGFSGIFFNNCFRNGLLPVTLPHADIAQLGDLLLARPQDAWLTVDLEAQTVTGPGGFEKVFRVPPVMRRMLLDGADEADYAVRHQAAVDVYRQRDRAERPWAYAAAPVPGPVGPAQRTDHASLGRTAISLRCDRIIHGNAVY